MMLIPHKSPMWGEQQLPTLLVVKSIVESLETTMVVR